MLLVKNLVDTVLSADLKELVNDGNSGNLWNLPFFYGYFFFANYRKFLQTENLTTVVSNLQITLNQYREEINRLAKTNLKILQPELENSENLVSQINSLHEEISHLKVDLEENVISLIYLSAYDFGKKTRFKPHFLN